MRVEVGTQVFEDVDLVGVTHGYVHIHYAPDPETHVPPKSKMIEHLGYMVKVLPS